VAVGLCFFLPSNTRILRLERSHRDFRLSMADVTEAYRLAHSADRAGVFALSGEFDAMRERLHHLRRHPDLAALEPDLLEVAAQMSLASRDLARTYAEEKVTRAKEFLKARQQEAAAFQDRLTMATYACSELKRWLQDIEADETVAAKQLERLERDLREILPTLGYDFEDQANVVQMPAKPAR
jgi:chromosome segregation ATPase